MKHLISLLVFLIFTLSSYSQFDVTFRISGGLDDPSLKATIEKNTSLFFSELGRAFVDETLPDFTGIDISPEAAQTIQNTWEMTGTFNCSRSNLELNCIHKANGGFQVRDIPIFMPVAEESGQKQEIVINYTTEGKIDNIYIILPEQSIASILTGEAYPVKELARRQKILDFVEQFRTAYITKDLNFLQKVFSDNALIITGKVVTEKTNDDVVQIPKEKIIYTQQSKVQYLRRMQLIFQTNKYINIKFTDYEIKQHPKYSAIYGVTFMQDWHTASYSDKGYVFLMIDFSDEDNPIIHVRTWQPDKYNGEKLKPEEIFKVTSFDITK